MSRLRNVAPILAVTAGILATGALAVPGAAQAAAPSCAGFTVLLTSADQVPDGVSVRALMEGLNYPHMCR